MEFVAGIPGTLGGAVAMNAGTKLGEMKDVVPRVELATADGAGFVARGRARASATAPPRCPRARSSTRLEVALRPGDVAASARRDGRRTATGAAARSRSTAPPSARRSRNPPGDFAGRLIEAVGLKGHRVGNATWSDRPRELRLEPRRRDGARRRSRSCSSRGRG